MNAIFNTEIRRSTFLHALSGSLVYPADDHVLRFLREGWFEYREQTIVSRLIRPGDHFLDIGAHCGLYSAIAQHRMDGNGSIVAVEPNPSLHPFIRQNAAGPTTFRLIEAAVATDDGDAVLYLDDPARSAYATLDSDHASAAAKRIPVSARTLESLVPEAVRSDFVFIKLDVEGVECPVLEQATDFLRSLPNVHLMVEFDENNLSATGRTSAELAAILRRGGFSLFEISRETGDLVPFTRQEPLWGENLIATRDPNTLLDRLANVSDHISVETQEFFERGKAAVRLYRRSEDLAKLLQSLSHLRIGLADVAVTLSENDADAVAIEARFKGTDKEADAVAELIHSEIGRLSGAAKTVVERVKQQNEELAKFRPLEHVQVGLARIARSLSGSESESAAIQTRFASSKNTGAIAHLIEDELGRLAGMADAVVERIGAQNEELDRQREEINRQRDEIDQRHKQVGRQRDEIDRLSAILNAPRLAQFLRLIKGPPSGIPSRHSTDPNGGTIVDVESELLAELTATDKERKRDR